MLRSPARGCRARSEPTYIPITRRVQPPCPTSRVCPGHPCPPALRDLMGGPVHIGDCLEHVSEAPVQVQHGRTVGRLGPQALVDERRERRVEPLAQPSCGHRGPRQLVVPRVQRLERGEPGGCGVQRPAESPYVGRRGHRPSARLLGRHVLAGAEAAADETRRAGDAEVDQRRLARVGHHVGGSHVEVEVARGVQVVEGRGQLLAEVGQVGRRQPPRAEVDDLLEVVAHQRLHDDDRHGFADRLERAGQVRMGDRLEQVPFQQQPVAHPLHLHPVRSDGLRGGTAEPAPREHGVHVQRLPSRQQLLDHVAGRHLLPGRKHQRLGEDRHRATPAPRAISHRAA